MNKIILYLIIVLVIMTGLFLTYNIQNEKVDVINNDLILLGSNQVKYGNYEGYLAVPNDNEFHPGLILIHEWWGLNDNIKMLADDFSKEGYVALAVDLYDGQVATDSSKAGELSEIVRGNMEEAFNNLNAAVDYLNNHPNVNEKLASVGWCFGGGWSYEMAKNDLGVDASIIYYGRFNPDDDLSKMRATILGHFGEDDTLIAIDEVNAFEAKLNTLSGAHKIFIYPNSGHAFANEQGSAYVQESADSAWTRSLDFLKRELV